MPSQVFAPGLLDGQVVVVTGGGSGLGRATAVELAALGAQVVIAGRRQEPLDETAALCEGGRCEGFVCDIREEDQVEALVAAVLDRHGHVDLLVNNAGGVCGQVGRPLEDVGEEDWRAIVDANLTSTFLCTRAVAPAMKAAGWGRIVNISSGAGRSVSLTGIQAYASAKAGQLGFTRQTAHELGPFGITVNAIAPGFVLSNPTSIAQWESYGEAGQQAVLDRIALRRLGEPEDIADGVVFLVRAKWLTGQVISIDGGSALF
jgi:3-oxoacyl-[acyl-carrier protein] reductase